MAGERIVDEKKTVKPTIQTKPAASKQGVRPVATAPARGPLNASKVLTLQSIVGNAAVQRLLDSSAEAASIQRDSDEEIEEEKETT